TLIAYTSTGCLFMDTVAVTVFHSPAVAPGPDTSLCRGQIVLLKAPAGFVQYSWQDGSTGSDFSAGQRGIYWVKATDNNHCSVVDTIIVTSSTTCKTGLYFPNAFTPDGGSNNAWRPVLTDGDLTAFRLLIYNRYGQKIFESANPQNGWDGSWQGKRQPSGAFAWVCSWQFAGQPAQTGKGSFLLLR
ncbi:MAG TPA: gliding motility-associated C-terminal domain-containing protein, partial [Chitinophagaceae bacterium]